MVGEVLSKPWIDSVVPVTVMIITLIVAENVAPGYLGGTNIASIGRQFSEIGLVALGLAVVVYCGGIDLSVGAVYAMGNFVALYMINVLQSPTLLVLAAGLVVGAAMGTVNGVLIGFFRNKAFLTTLAALVIWRAALELLLLANAARIAGSNIDNESWFWLGEGSILGVPVDALVLIVVAAVFHILMTRSRIGWRLQAVGGSRRAAHHAGINVRATVFSAYVVSGTLSALAGTFYAARQDSVGFDTGVGLEFTVITGIILGGVALGGGRGSVIRALVGTIIAFVISNLLLRQGLPGGYTSLVLGVILLVAMTFDIKWEKNRHKLLQKSYISPAFLLLPRPAAIDSDPHSPYAMNARLSNVEVIGLDQVDGPEDVILDREGRLYTGTRQGWIIRFSGPNFEKREVFADIGGRPLGLAFDAAGNLVTCVCGMGLYGVRPSGEIFKLTDHTNRSWFTIRDDSIIRLADDLDVAPDGRIFFSDGSTRYDIHTWLFDGLEARPNGRLLCYDPSKGTTSTVFNGAYFANGVCASHDGRSVLFAESYACVIRRLWISGPKTGKVEVVIPNLPGHPDNINRASDGSYWLALVGMRSAVWDRAMTMPSFRLRMIKQLPPDEWLCPNVNIGCIVKFDDNGNILDCLWDREGRSVPLVTSMREHEGWLYLGGLTTNRISRVRVKPRSDSAHETQFPSMAVSST
jgi:ribose transport system permease protein